MIVETIKSWFAWETVRDTGCHLYQHNTVTGERRIRPSERFCGHQPIDQGWLDTGEWTPPPKTPSVESFLI